MKAYQRLLALLFIAGVVLHGCNKPEEDSDYNCSGVECLNGGTCVPDGNSYTCHCEQYYEGVDCGSTVSERYVGTYTKSSGCTNLPSTITITKFDKSQFKMETGNPAGQALFYVHWDDATLALRDDHVFFTDGNQEYYVSTKTKIVLTNGTTLTMTFTDGLYQTPDYTTVPNCSAGSGAVYVKQ